MQWSLMASARQYDEGIFTTLKTYINLIARMYRWLYDLDMDTSVYTAVSGLLLPKWETHGKPFGRLHSLFTRTCTLTETGVSIYLRPLFETLVNQGQEPVYNWEAIEREHYSQPEANRNGVDL